jgi:hypothetical protein
MAKRKPVAAEEPVGLVARVAVMAAGFLAATAAAIAIGTRVGVDRWKDGIWAGKPAFEAQLALAQHGFHPAFVMSVVLALAGIAAAEMLRVRFTLVYMAIGGLAVVAAAYLMGVERAGTGVDRMVIWQVYATAGILGGAIYWLVAGRSACRFSL